jgi:hypothetical protein
VKELENGIAMNAPIDYETAFEFIGPSTPSDS